MPQTTVYPDKPYLSQEQFQREICKQLTPAEQLIQTVQLIAADLNSEGKHLHSMALLTAIQIYRTKKEVKI